ncbi:unnamed protein product [Chironomus riparius]|uniref:5'-nucleotidase domain-containing protein 3 n=1 Tax=Chironomus riparius TaxID=315576 RepID=A0A9N9WVT5_9DIPT|nr:unnamed protein product [Chironomus riparius]
MFVRSLKLFTNNNLCLQRNLALNIHENKSIRSISTSVYLSNKYDELYKERYATFKSKKLPKNVNRHGVFAANELDLDEVEVYGFDYDYTISCYKKNLNYLLYNLGRDSLVQRYKYPKDILNLDYVPNYTIRGLHYDIEKGLLLKLDSFLQIQLGTVYRGLTPVPDDEVLEIYKNRVIPVKYVEGDRQNGQNGRKMVQLADLFSVPEMYLLSTVTEFFNKHHIDYHPEIMFRDVKNAIGSSHPVMHKIVGDHVKEYIKEDTNMKRFFQRLINSNKKLFLVTNSPFPFVNKGMTFLCGDDWREFFDVIIVNARKPKFFTEHSRPLRIYDEKMHTHTWDRVTKLEKGVIYYEGTVKTLQKLTGWYGHKVLYFGDHPYSDLADVTLEHGWRTGAIINELTHEIETLNNDDFKMSANWLQMLTSLMEDIQDHETVESEEALQKWAKERDGIRYKMKQIFNPQFGSVFRTYHNPTYFSRRLFRFADIYTSKITNLLHYSVKHTFYPRRGVMPHEYLSYFM